MVNERNGSTPALVSVVICVYNNWPDAEMTIESALQQSYQPVEVIVIDNSSTDATPEKVPRRFGRRVRYLRQTNKGDAGAYNAGFDLAKGEFIQFVDGDDVLAPNKLQKQVELFRADPALDIVYGDVRKFQAMAGVADWKDLAMQPCGDMLGKLAAPEGIWIDTLGVLFRRRALEKVGRWHEGMYVADLDYWLRAAWAGCRFGHCPGVPMGFSRQRPGQMTGNATSMARGEEAVWDKALGYVTREPYGSLIAAKLARLRFNMAHAGDWQSRQEALAMLALAKSTHPQTISATAHAIGYALIVLPGLAKLARSRWLRPVRLILAPLFHFGRPGFFRRNGRSCGAGVERTAPSTTAE